MCRIIKYMNYRGKEFVRQREIKKQGLLAYANSIKKYADREVLGAEAINEYIFNKIVEGVPFLAARFGATELLNMRMLEFPIQGQKNSEKAFDQLCLWSGFFPNDKVLNKQFTELMKYSAKNIDVLAIWFQAFEDYYIKLLMSKDIKCTYLLNFEPWAASKPWTEALEGKNVLVIHPFAETIQKQYMKRELIFPGTNILPEFNLKTIKAVQTLAGNNDERFATWFEALEWMYSEAMKMEFDVAIIGCGAYGLPLAAKLKESGKQSIHLAGATQILFGIKGKRWETDPAFEYVRKWFNDEWVYPDEQEKVKDGNKVENACYW